ncbi:MAG: hypothetical protein QOG39_1906 [Acidimicrobiaceae bacterium]
MADHTEPSPDTEAEEEREAAKAHTPDRPPTRDEEAAADREGGVDPKVAAAYEAANRTGANVKGEGQIEP